MIIEGTVLTKETGLSAIFEGVEQPYVRCAIARLDQPEVHAEARIVGPGRSADSHRRRDKAGGGARHHRPARGGGALRLQVAQLSAGQPSWLTSH